MATICVVQSFWPEGWPLPLCPRRQIERPQVSIGHDHVQRCFKCHTEILLRAGTLELYTFAQAYHLIWQEYFYSFIPREKLTALQDCSAWLRMKENGEVSCKGGIYVHHGRVMLIHTEPQKDKRTMPGQGNLHVMDTTTCLWDTTSKAWNNFVKC